MNLATRQEAYSFMKPQPFRGILDTISRFPEVSEKMLKSKRSILVNSVEPLCFCKAGVFDIFSSLYMRHSTSTVRMTRYTSKIPNCSLRGTHPNAVPSLDGYQFPRYRRHPELQPGACPLAEQFGLLAC